jgi:PAS domain S-box-containing protein
MEAPRRTERHDEDPDRSPESKSTGGPSAPVVTRLLEEIGAIVWEGDPQACSFTYVSGAAERLLGFPVQRWIGEPTFWIDHIHPDDRDWVVAFCHEHMARLEDHQFDYRMLTASGQIVWFRHMVRVEADEAGRPVRAAGVMVDITSLEQAKVRAEHVLGAMQALSEDLRLEEVIDRVLASAIECAGAKHGALLLDNAGAETIVAEGWLSESGEVRTTHFDEPIPTCGPSDYLAGADARSLLCMPIVKHGQRIGAVVLERCMGGKTVTGARLETLRVLLGQGAIALDNARLYAQLERGEAQWRSLVDGVPDVIALLDQHGRVEFINHVPPYINSRLELRADTFMDASSAEAWRAAFSEVVVHGEPRELEVCVVPPGGSRQWFMTRIAPIEIAGRGASKAERYLSVATEITARKRLEAQLRQQQRLESVGTLASGVAHEINNPVQGILNYAELIADRANDPEIVREFAEEITRESHRVATIVRNLLAFSRQEAEQQLEPQGVRTLIEDTLSLIHSILRKDQIAVELTVPDGLPPIRCRVQQIQQVIMNLVANARDALNERYEQFDVAKRITIRASSYTRAGRGWVRISVADQAGGIPEHVRARIFDPFFTTKGRDQGTGLGLAVSHGIAADHDGELSVDTELGVGSTFHLDLPVQG